MERSHRVFFIETLVSVAAIGPKLELREVHSFETHDDVHDDITARWSTDNGRTWSEFVPVQPSNNVNYAGVTVGEGEVHAVPDEMTTPFAVVTFFEPDMILPDMHDMDLGRIEAYLDEHLPTPNIFYAVTVEGQFRYVKTRSVPEQRKPYPPLLEVTKNQPTFALREVQGVMVGFRCPEYMRGINVPGYHFHFLTAEKDAGGHVLEVEIEKAVASIDYVSGISLVLPSQEGFYLLDFSREGEAERELMEVER